MNLNMKLDSEEDQGIQYVNRFAINIPSTAFNLNIVNSGLNSQGYILNPVNQVGQNIVAYQPSMAVQSYFAVPTESEGNILHSLPVGVSVPVGLPVQTGFLPNNFVNTSIIIGNENCNSQDVTDSSNNNQDREEGLKGNYLEKPIEDLINSTDVQNIDLNCSPNLSAEPAGKKPCPLEMSIKAANIDIEFEKCDQEISILVENGLTPLGAETKLTGNNSLHDSGNDTLHMSVTESPMQQTAVGKLIPAVECNPVKKTEITWEDGTGKENLSNANFQESLICEVEEVNDDDDDDDDDVVEEEEEEEREGKGSERKNYEITRNEKDEENVEERKENSESSEDSEGLPLSVALKLKKSQGEKICLSNAGKKRKGESEGNKVRRGKKSRKGTGDEEEWSESDDDALNLTRIKNEFVYKCYFEPKNTKSSSNSLILRLGGGSTKFSRVRSCCSKKECSRKISVKDQMLAHQNFHELESNGQKDLYLANCIEHVQKVNRANSGSKWTPAKDKSLTNGETPATASSIQLEIENESNGNQKLSDEIQNAINESLKDCGVEISGKGTLAGPGEEPCPVGADKEEKNNWHYYIVVDGERKKVCLQFLLKLLRITKNRIKQLQKKILSGTPISDDSNTGKTEQKLDEICAVARRHLDSVSSAESSHCVATPPHRYLTANCTREGLFINFKEFYYDRKGKVPHLKFPSYKRFLDRESSLSFLPKSENACSECEYLKKRKKQNKNKIGKKKSDLESDEEPSVKCKKLKLTIPLKGVNKGNSNPSVKRSGSKSKNSEKKGSKFRGQQKEKTSGATSAASTPTRGRDVWSLMLLHLETMPYRECNSCTNKKKHRFLASTFTTQGLFEDYRRYFLKETNSELGLGFTMYEKYFNRNCNYTIRDIGEEEAMCPRCLSDQAKC